jgi:hypothetical protein
MIPPRRGTTTPTPAPGRRGAPTEPSVPRAKREQAMTSPQSAPAPVDKTRHGAPTLPEIQAAPKADPARRATTKTAVPRARREQVTAATETNFALLTQYVNALPDGLESYPKALASGALVLGLLLDPLSRLPLGGGLPPPLEELMGTSPPASSWVPLVKLCALHAAVYDFAFAEKGGVAAYEEWTFQRNLRLAGDSVYRKILAVESPEALLASYNSARWSAFYRGTSLHVMSVAKRSASLRLTHPAYAWPGISRIALGAALRAALVIARAKSATVTSRELSVRAAHFEVRWS